MVALLLAGCAGTDSVVEVGELAYDQGMPMIDVPATATVGAPVIVDVATQGGGCITAESTSVASTDEQVDVTPYDRREIVGDHEACTLQLVFLHHQVSLSFATAGTKTILFHVRIPQAQSYVLGVIPAQLTVQ